MSGGLHKRTAIVTGAARGIGFAIAKTLSESGANVVLADNGASINGTNLDESVVELAASQINGPTTTFAESVNSTDSAKRLVQSALETFGQIDIVINNAAIIRDSFIFKGVSSDWDEVIATNLSGPFYILAATTPFLRDQYKRNTDYKHGRIVNITSTAGFYGNYGQAAYASAKAGLLGLTRTVALDMAQSNITCNAIAPFASTRVTESIKPMNEIQSQYKERSLRLSASHVATFVNYLCGDSAQDVSGQLFAVRGREVFLFNQPRPKTQIVNVHNNWTVENLAEAIHKKLKPQFIPLETDLEAFNSEPII